MANRSAVRTQPVAGILKLRLAQLRPNPDKGTDDTDKTITENVDKAVMSQMSKISWWNRCYCMYNH